MNTGGLLGNVSGGLIVTLIVFVIVFLIFREVFCWYWKINQQVALLTEIRDLLASSPRAGNADASEMAAPAKLGPSTTSGPAANTRGDPAIQRLAERVRGDPRLPIDEKIELLQLMGGKFQWDKGSTCRASYKGQDLTFPGGKEFSDWLTATVLPEALGSGLSRRETATQQEARGPDPKATPEAVVAEGLEVPLRVARSMSQDGYSAAEIASRLVEQGVGRDEANVIAHIAKNGSPSSTSAARPFVNPVAPKHTAQAPSVGQGPASSSAVLPRHCRACGKGLEAGAKFCEACGAQI